MLTSKSYEGSKIICEFNSSNIKKAVYDISDKKLVLTFNHSISYEYSNVPHEVFSDFTLSESQGKYFHSKINKNYEYKKILG